MRRGRYDRRGLSDGEVAAEEGIPLCLECGVAIIRERSHGRKDQFRFCSRACYFEYRKIEVRTWTCPTCHETVSRKVRGSDKGIFCSPLCSSLSRSTGEKKLGGKTAWNTCSRCDRPKSGGGSKGGICIYCRRQEDKERIDAMTLGELRETLGTHAFHAKVRGYARRIGVGQACLECGYSNHVVVCHIKPVSDFSMNATISEVNTEDNLVSLCPNHHWEFDHGLLFPKLEWGLSERKIADHYARMVEKGYAEK